MTVVTSRRDLRHTPQFFAQDIVVCDLARKLLELVRRGRLDLTPLLTHTYSLERIGEAYKLFGERREGVIKVAIKP